MIKIAGYDIKNCLYKGTRSKVFRAARTRDSLDVVLKVHAGDFPKQPEITRFRREFEIGQQFDNPLIIRYHAIESHHHGLAIVAEDFGGVGLVEVIPDSGLPLEKFLNIAIQMTQALNLVHKHGIIHKDIKPSNVLIHPETNQIKLIDFGISASLEEGGHADHLEGTVAYISPEQTGRMNRKVDYRSDFYSLGVTFYELLCGHLPFSATDASEMIHCHIAKMPNPLYLIKPQIPKTISDIVEKLMAKCAEDRYQSSSGLRADLERCLDMMISQGPIDPFPLGERDLSNRFQLSQKLYGRTRDMALMHEVLSRVDEGGKEVVLVSGPTGSGKSTLIHEIQKTIINKRGYFISGQFDEGNSGTPYGAIIGALRDLLRQILVERDARVRAWKQAILHALGDGANVLVEALPELERIIGPQKPVESVSSLEAQNRFHYALKRLVYVAARCKQPLALLLDDLEQADDASLRLMTLLLTEKTVRQFVWFGTWEKKTLPPEHPLTLALEDLEKNKVTITEIDLQPLSVRDTTRLIAETLHMTESNVALLADLVARKTEGNPYFVCEFLKTLSHKGLLFFDNARGRWRWDLKAIDGLEMTPNVVNLLAEQIAALPGETRATLSLAAAMGQAFDLKTLSDLSGDSTEDLVNFLWPALEEGLISSDGPVDLGSAGQSLGFKFSHDRLQKVAYEMIDSRELGEIHLRIGRLLLQRGRNEDDRIFQIIGHLNKGRHLITAPDELIYLVKADVLAAKKAITAGSFDTALRNLALAMECLPNDCWESEYPIVYDIYATRAQCAWLCADIREAEKLYAALLLHAHPGYDKIRAYNMLVSFYTFINNFEKAWSTAQEALSRIDIELHEAPSKLRSKWEQWRLGLHLAGRPPEQLLALPICEDPEKNATMELLMTTGDTLYQMGKVDHYAAVCIKMLRLSFSWGNGPASAYAYTALAMLFCSQGNFSDGHAYGKVAIELVDRFNEPDIRCRVYFLFGCFINHWQNHLRTSEKLFDDGYQAGVEAGNLVYSAWCVFSKCSIGLLAGNFLKKLEEEVLHQEHYLRQTGANFSFPLLPIARQLTRALQGQTPKPDCLDEGQLSEETLLEQMKKRNFLTGIAYMHFAQMLTRYYNGDRREALKYSDLLQKNIEGLTSTTFVVEADFYAALTRFALYDKVDENTRLEFRTQIKGCLARLASQERSCSENYHHRHQLVRAEWARIHGEEAVDFYDDAIDSAYTQGFPHHVALGNELAGRYWLQRGRLKVARVYLTEAWYGYQRWGAETKANLLKKEFPGYLGDMEHHLLTTESHATEESGTTPENQKIDLQSITKAFLAISSEIDFNKLVGKMLKIMMENAGAQRGFLVLTSSGVAKIEAMADGGSEVEVMQGEPIHANPRLSEAIVRFVIRSGETVVLTDAIAESMFSKDDYIQTRKPKSVLCTPIRQKERIAGALYLENNLTTNAFSEERVSTLEILLAQAALCLEHSRLYMETISLNTALKKEIEERKTAEAAVRNLNTDLEQRVIERTAQLEASQKELVEKAHAAGMADIATSVLHNVGNILSSVTTSSQLIRSSVESPTLNALTRANGLLRENFDTLDEFILENPKGKKLLRYYLELEKLFARDYEKMSENLENLMMKIDSIRDVIMAQQSFASGGFKAETMLLSKVVDDAISIMDNSMSRHEIHLEKNYTAVPPLMLQKTKLTHIIINLLKNAKEAMLNVAAGEKEIIIDIHHDNDWAYVAISDVGCGIAEEIKEKIFTHGFTTKKNGHGFGLHSCANAMTEMGGCLRANSEGPGKGATFTLQFPLKHEEEMYMTSQETMPV